ncbi:hypothetical protein MUK42_05860 [Musa troglodytarum]|uniref:Uncharacterized protein n=1 Tax=Musa troglodytarum TaxID=320322 RepID=A0A9E7HCM4_9LILI|nr:hypothetical protein MUK42_05860 [Musa troglodytarum]
MGGAISLVLGGHDNLCCSRGIQAMGEGAMETPMEVQLLAEKWKLQWMFHPFVYHIANASIPFYSGGESWYGFRDTCEQAQALQLLTIWVLIDVARITVSCRFLLVHEAAGKAQCCSPQCTYSSFARALHG